MREVCSWMASPLETALHRLTAFLQKTCPSFRPVFATRLLSAPFEPLANEVKTVQLLDLETQLPPLYRRLGVDSEEQQAAFLEYLCEQSEEDIYNPRFYISLIFILQEKP